MRSWSAAAPTIAWLESKNVRFSYMTGYPDYHPDEPGGLLTGRAITPKAIRPAFLEPLEHKIQPKLPMGDGGPPIPDTGPEGPLWGGQSLIAQLLKACADAGVEVWTSAAFTDLVLTDGQVTGVRFFATALSVEVGVIAGVLLASGGFDHNAAMRTELQHAAVGHAKWTIGVAGNTGDGIAAGIKAGAATDLLEDCWWAPGLPASRRPAVVPAVGARCTDRHHRRPGRASGGSTRGRPTTRSAT